MVEVWKPIKNFENHYHVSNLGNVKSLERVIIRKDGRIMTFKSKLLKKQKTTNGYLSITIDRKHKSIHRLVAEAFLHKIEGKYDVNHIDCDKFNNCVTNLEWANKSENIQHAIKNNRFKKYLGKNHWRSLPILQIDLDGNLIKKWDSIMDVKRELNLDSKSIIYCCKGKIYKKVGGYKWRYENV